MRAKTYRLGILFSMLVVLLLGNVVLADDGQSPGSALVPVIADANPCTKVVNAGQSIQAAVVPATGNAVVCVRAGVYSEQIKLKPKNAGITLMAYPGETVVIDGRNQLPAVTAKNSTPPLILVDGENITVDGFEVRNSAARGVTVSKSNVIVRNMLIRDNRGIGLLISSATSINIRNVLVENNVVHNNILKNADGTAGGNALAFIQVENSTARGNVVSHNYGEGLVAGRYSRNITLEDNTVYDNRGANIYLINTINVLVRRNFVFCTNDPISWRGTGSIYRPGPGLQVRDEDFKKPSPPVSTGQVILNNIVVGCGTNFGVSSQLNGGGLNNAVVANNTFVNARSASGEAANNIEFDGRASYQNSRFVNNVIVQTVPGTITRVQTATGTPNMASFTVSNNLYSKTPTNGWPSNEAGRVVANPLLASLDMPMMNALPNPAGYILLPGSPAVDNGTNVAQVTDDFFATPRNGALDMGADELGGGTSFGNFAAVMSLLTPGQ